MNYTQELAKILQDNKVALFFSLNVKISHVTNDVRE